MKFPAHSITTKLLLLFLLVGLSTVTIIGTYSFYSAKRAIMRRTVDQLISVRAVKKQQLEYFFSEKIKNLKNLANNEILREHFIDSRDIGYLRSYFIAYGFTNLYMALNAQQNPGQYQIVVCDSVIHPFIPRNLRQHIEKMTAGLRNTERVVVSDLFYRSESDSIPVCLIGCNMLTKVPSVVILEIPVTEINRIMLNDNSRIGLGNSGEAYLVGSDFLMRSASRFIKGSLLRVPVRSETVKRALAGETGADITIDYRGVRVFSAYAPVIIPGLNWVVMAEIDYEEAMVPVAGLRNDILLVSLVISIFILGFAKVITKMVTQPIIRLKKAAALLGKGDFNNKVQIGSQDEIGLLAETFNTMSDQLKEERGKRIQALYDGQEMERRRISRELHDGLGQKLVGAKLQIENCNDDDHACLLKTMQETKGGLYSIVEELRRISNDLMPAALDELGLETALRNLCYETGRQTGIEIDYGAGITAIPSGNTAIYLFRIAQEGIQNAIKHAHAKSLSVQLIETRDSLILIIEDNGAGFVPAYASKGNGLSNMRDRTALLGGSFSIESEPGKGTTVRVKIPHQP